MSDAFCTARNVVQSRNVRPPAASINGSARSTTASVN
jgi:hypothetical protein